MSTTLVDQLETYFAEMEEEHRDTSADRVAGYVDRVREVPPPPAIQARRRPKVWVVAAVSVGVALALATLPSLIRATGDDRPPASDISTLLPTEVLSSTTTVGVEGSTTTVVVDEPVSPGTEFDSFLSDWAARNDQVGISAAVMSGDGSIWVGAAGLSDRGELISVAPGDRFQAGSVTKTFMSVLALRLAEEELIDLDGPVSAHLPDFPSAETITIRMLLGHRAGVYDPSIDLINESSGPPDMARVFTVDELLEATASGTPVFEPGTQHDYSNGGYILLGAVLEAATGQSASTLLAENVLEPLGLENTLLFDESLPDTAVVNAYTDLDLDGIDDSTGTTPLPGVITAAWTAGGVISTPNDLVMFLDAVFAGDFLDTESRTALTDQSSGTSGYGLGIYQKGRLWGHDGGIKGYLSAVFHDPAQQITVAVMTNHFGPQAPQADAAASDLARLARTVLSPTQP